MRIENVKVGDPMGFKLNGDDNVVLNSVINALKTYHGDKYVVGYDTAFVDKPHFHIHFFSIKDVTANAIKVFRNSLKTKIPELTRSDKLYTGQDIESGNKLKWIAYAIKETLVDTQGIDITDDIKILAKASFETKRQNKVYSEQKKNKDLEKKQFKEKMLEYIKENIDNYIIPEIYRIKISDYEKVRLLVIKYLMTNGKEGSLKKGIIDTYVMYVNIHLNNWDEFKILGNLYCL